MNPLHVIAQLIQIFNVTITYLANHELRLAAACVRTLTRLDSGLLLLPWQWSD
jgi:hypothetical protein